MKFSRSVIFSLMVLGSFSIWRFPRTLKPLSSNRTQMRCPNALLFSYMRHGSTWLIDSIDHCRYSKHKKNRLGTYNDGAFLNTELWHVHNSPLQNMSVDLVLEYLHHNSVKVFETGFRYQRRIESLLTRLADVPVVVLRRRLENVCSSYITAKRTGLWAQVKGDATSKKKASVCGRKCREKCEILGAKMQKHFDEVAIALNKSGVSADWLWYEDIKDRPVFSLQNNQCYVMNCNFA